MRIVSSVKLYDENNNNFSTDSHDNTTWTLIYLTVELFNIQYVNGDSTWKDLNVLYNFNSVTKCSNYSISVRLIILNFSITDSEKFYL